MQMELLQRQYANQFREELCKNSKKGESEQTTRFGKKGLQNSNTE
jgi:hypothetical protein